MPYPLLDRSKLYVHPLAERGNKVEIARDAVSPDTQPGELSAAGREVMGECIQKVRTARANGRPVMLAFGAHTIKNGLAPVLIRLIEHGWVTLLATNGAGIIHDWEFAYQGLSSEDVRANVDQGQFGIWQETGFYINLAIVVGAYEGLGYGESIGKLIQREGLDPDFAAAAIDLAGTLVRWSVAPGFLSIPHPFKSYSAQAAAYRLNVPFTAHPMIGHDIIYTHPANHCAAIGRTGQRDFLTFANQVHQLEGGVYLSVGSAVMSPMIFEKSLSMSQNLEIQNGGKIKGHHMVIVDLAESSWDWQNDGEPPMNSPAYYLRYCKTFSRMGGTMRYLSAHNRDFLLTLLQELEKKG